MATTRSEQKEQLKLFTGYISSFTQLESKAKQVVWLLIREVSQRKVAKIMKMSRDTIRNIWDAHKKGLPLPEPMKIGRPTKQTPQLLFLVKQIAFAVDKIDPKILSRTLAEEYNIIISERTCYCMLLKCKFKYKQLPKAPLLTPEQKQRRILFAKTILANHRRLPAFIFSDESRFAENFQQKESICSKNALKVCSLKQVVG